MDTLQAELRDTYPILNIQIVGLNEFGQDPAGANGLMTAGRTTPWLQDVDANSNQISDVWYDSWGVTYRDVIIIDGQNETVDTYNLTSNDLGVAANYATLRDKLLSAAMTEQKPLQNQRNRFDINDDGFVVPGDVLRMVNEINANGARRLLPPTGTSLAAPYWDCNGDNFFSPVDILQVINFIEGVNAEGEASGEPEAAATSVAIAAPESLSHLSAEFDSTTAQAVDVLPAQVAEPTIPVIVVQSSTEELLQPAKPDDDAFWASYWPGI